MMTFRQLAAGLKSLPTATAWYLGDLGEARVRWRRGSPTARRQRAGTGTRPYNQTRNTSAV